MTRTFRLRAPRVEPLESRLVPAQIVVLDASKPDVDQLLDIVHSQAGQDVLALDASSAAASFKVRNLFAELKDAPPGSTASVTLTLASALRHDEHEVGVAELSWHPVRFVAFALATEIATLATALSRLADVMPAGTPALTPRLAAPVEAGRSRPSSRSPATAAPAWRPTALERRPWMKPGAISPAAPAVNGDTRIYELPELLPRPGGDLLPLIEVPQPPAEEGAADPPPAPPSTRPRRAGRSQAPRRNPMRPGPTRRGRSTPTPRSRRSTPRSSAARPASTASTSRWSRPARLSGGWRGALNRAWAIWPRAV